MALSENKVSPFTRDIGKQIPLEQAQRWINNYRQGQSAKFEIPPRVAEAEFINMVNGSNAVVGLSFHRAIDDDGGYHIIIAPVIDDLPAWSTEYVLDAETNELLDAVTAERWTSRYKTEQPQGIWSHFFGIHVFNKDFLHIDIIEALNDEGIPQLLLYMTRVIPNGNGRT